MPKNKKKTNRTENTPNNKGNTDIKKILKIQKELYNFETELLEEKNNLYQKLLNDSVGKQKPITTDQNKIIAKKGFKKTKGEIEEIKPLQNIKFKDKLKMRTNPENSYLIEMLFSNGTSRTFTIKTNEEVFAYKGRIYYLRKEENWFDLTHKERKLIFHDDYFSPINNKQIIRIVDNDCETAGNEKAFFAVTPSNAKDLVLQSFVGQLLRGDNMSKEGKILIILIIIVLIIQIVQVLGIIK